MLGRLFARVVRSPGVRSSGGRRLPTGNHRRGLPGGRIVRRWSLCGALRGSVQRLVTGAAGALGRRCRGVRGTARVLPGGHGRLLDGRVRVLAAGWLSGRASPGRDLVAGGLFPGPLRCRFLPGPGGFPVRVRLLAPLGSAGRASGARWGRRALRIGGVSAARWPLRGLRRLLRGVLLLRR
ncbi:hypothetical protein SAMN04489718_3411 [Actinopolyspora saharensis]|uniref:Uncharacterized protein n=1 Tax=Actinopolyspora saharensis TaxID=995062 RepID=A0A1H1G441_9ACTN|nr:hypothetical protein SAMN04489718_3411 [Actinopolyspora saharensis]